MMSRLYGLPGGLHILIAALWFFFALRAKKNHSLKDTYHSDAGRLTTDRKKERSAEGNQQMCRRL
jgi:hypothetical protein